MPTFDVAHIREQGVDLITVLVGPSFGSSSSADQDAAMRALQACAAGAGLAGTIVPVWDAGGGRLAFRAPQSWHPFLQSLDPLTLVASVNRRLTCNG